MALLGAGASPDAVNRKQETPRSLASHRGALQLQKVLSQSAGTGSFSLPPLPGIDGWASLLVSLCAARGVHLVVACTRGFLKAAQNIHQADSELLCGASVQFPPPLSPRQRPSRHRPRFLGPSPMARSRPTRPSRSHDRSRSRRRSPRTPLGHSLGPTRSPPLTRTRSRHTRSPPPTQTPSRRTRSLSRCHRPRSRPHPGLTKVRGF